MANIFGKTIEQIFKTLLLYPNTKNLHISTTLNIQQTEIQIKDISAQLCLPCEYQIVMYREESKDITPAIFAVKMKLYCFTCEGISHDLK